MKMSRMEILRQVQRNMTYESIRFNNKQISDEMVKSTIQQYFPRVFGNERWRQLSFFTKAMKDEQFYKKMRNLVSMQLSLQQYLQEMEIRQMEKSKIQDYENSHEVEELHNNKKMTRAALARRNQQTQQQLRKDQIYVRLTPKTQQCLKWMLCNRKFPRIQCKLSCNQHIQYLISYLSNKWLSSNKGNNRIVLYPDVGSYLKNNLSAKQREKILKQPLNNFFMFTDVMIGSGIGQNGILNLHYEILEKKKDVVLVGGSSGKQHGVGDYQHRVIGSGGEKKHTGYVDSNGQMVQTDSYQCGSNKKPNLQKQQDLLANNNSNNNNRLMKQYVPVGSKQLTMGNNNNSLAKSPNICNNFPGMMSSSIMARHNTNNPNNHHESSLLLNNNAHYSNHFLSNQSNLLNPNRSLYHDEESIFKSIGFFALGGGNNTYGFDKKNDFHLLAVNSNSYIDVGHMNQIKERGKEVSDEGKGNQQKQKEKLAIVTENAKITSNLQSQEQQKQQTLQQVKQQMKLEEQVLIKIEREKKQVIVEQQQQKQLYKQKDRQQRSSPRTVKIIKPIMSSPPCPKREPLSHSINKQQRPSSNQLQQVSEIKQEQIHQVKNHEGKLLDLRNAINLLQEVEGFHEGTGNEEISQKSLKQVKTVSIKKKLVN